MTAKSEVRIIKADLSQHNFIYLVCLSDFHFDEPQSDHEAIKGYVDWIKAHKNAYTILNGDLVTAPTERSAASLYEAAEPGGTIEIKSLDQCANELEALLKPIANRILAACSGGHEFNHLFKLTGSDWTYNLMRRLGREKVYARDGGVLLIKTKPLSVADNLFTSVVFTHGWGGARTRGAKIRKLEYLSSAFDADIYVMSHDHCFSEDTEILTKQGWKTYDQLSFGEEALTFKTIGEKQLEWKPIQALHVYDDFKEMVHIDGNSIDLLITPQHTLLYRSQDSRTKHIRWRRGTAEHILSLNYRIEFPISASYKTNGISISDDFLRLVIWLISEAHFHEDSAGIRIGQLKGKHVRLQELLDRLSIDYRLVWTKTSAGGDYAQFNIHANSGKEIRKIVAEKRLPPILQEMNDAQFQVFLDELPYGDGWLDRRYTYYATKDRVLAGQLQELAVKHGYRATDTISSSGMHQLTFAKREATGTRNIRQISYTGKVWCITVANHTVVVRRNGKLAITGNTQNLTRDNYLTVPSWSKAEVSVHRKLLVSTGAFRGYAGYPLRSGYAPSDLGTPRIRIGKKIDGDGKARLDIHASL